jgi:hypothetical protein
MAAKILVYCFLTKFILLFLSTFYCYVNAMDGQQERFFEPVNGVFGRVLAFNVYVLGRAVVVVNRKIEHVFANVHPVYGNVKSRVATKLLN